jgi:tetraacyldisaccharide 4'-kinase
MGKRRCFLLYPLSLVYGLITSFRNFLYNSGILHSEKFSVPVICVGNITVGGTGKTPHTGYIADLLRNEFSVAVLSRGYKRKSRGFIIASSSTSVKETGDEPYQLFRNFPDVLVAVDNDRVNGVKMIITEYPGTDVIILDDGFQHRKIKPGLSILLSDFSNLITDDFMLPYGNLRESVRNADRADLIIMTKTPHGISDKIRKEIITKFDRITRKKIFFSEITYRDPVPLFAGKEQVSLSPDEIKKKESGVLLITGIASPEPLKRYLEKYFAEIVHLKFPDHHYFNDNDIQMIQSGWINLKSKFRYVITTEKDSVRLKEFTNIDDSIKRAFYYIPVGVRFLNDTGREFDNLISDYVRKNKGNNRIS